MARVYGYVRASTTDQVATLDVQKALLEKEIKHRFEEYEVGGILVDAGVSGGLPLAQRPMGKTLIDMLQKGDAVLFTKLDRGFRNCRDMLETVERWQKQGVRLVMLDLQIDTGTPMGKLMMTIAAAFAEWERAIISQRTKEALQALIARGRPAGQVPYGYKTQKVFGEKLLVRDNAQREAGALIVKLIDAGWSFRQVYSHLWQKGLRRPNGSEYSLGSIYKMNEAERRVQATEKARSGVSTGVRDAKSPPSDPQGESK